MNQKLLGNNCAILLLFLICSFSAKAQNFSVSGTVTDDAGKNLDGATVREKGSNNSTLTSQAGTFKLNVSSGKAVLQISSIGYESNEITVNNRAEVSVSLKSTNETMDEVVVIGYATVRKKDVTGAVSGINQQDIKSRPVTNAIQAMQGKVAGVDITSNERPGTVGNINIRGVRSITASSSPLFVVDGIPLTTGGIEYINPNDIETIDVLKDASATAIYGSRGANGVVIVSTKQGKAGGLQISLNSSVTTENIRNFSPAMNAGESVEFLRWARFYGGLSPLRGDQPTRLNDSVNVIRATSDQAAWANVAKGWASGTWNGSQVPTTDWTGLVSQQGVTNDHTLSVSGGTNKIKAYSSFGALNTKGTSIGQEFTRYSGKASVDITPKDWFSMGVNLNLTNGIQEFGQSQGVIGAFVGSPGSSIYESARRLYTYAVPFEANGERVLNPGGDIAFKSVVDEWKYSQDQRRSLRAFGSLYTQLNFGEMHPALKGLKYRMNFGPDFASNQTGIYIDGLSSASSGLSSASLRKDQTFSYTLDNLLYYDRVVKKHSFGLTLLQTATKFTADPVNTIVGTGVPFASQKWYTLNSTVIPAANLSVRSTEDLIERQLHSYMARLTYAYDGKYILTASTRQDGASQFAEGRKYSMFPSAALAWRIDQENFMKGINWVDDLKLRVGAGVTGNSAVDPYTTKGAINPLFYPFGSAVTAGTLPASVYANQELGWEKTTQYNYGLEFSLFKRRISGQVDFYTSQTKDLLLRREIPTITGFGTTLQNIGQTANRGIDIGINTTNITSKNFQWSSSLNASWQKEKIVSLANGKSNDINNRWFIGQPVGVIYGIKSNGLWKASDSEEMQKFNANLTPATAFKPGNVRPVDQNGDYKIDANNDRVILGNTRPRWILGMTNSFSYKKFELSVFVYGRLNYLFNTGGEAMTARAATRKLNYYTEVNTDADYQRPLYSTGNGDIYSGSLGFQKASFIKVRNISASYAFTGKALKAITLSNLRAFVQVANPGRLYSKIDFLDMDVTSATSNRGFTFGINAAF